MAVRNAAQILKATADEHLRRIGVSLVELEDRLNAIVNGSTAVAGSSSSATASLAIRTVTEDTTATAADDIILCDDSLANITVQLPPVSAAAAKTITVVKLSNSAFAVGVISDGTDGGSAILFSQWQAWHRLPNVDAWVPVDEAPADPSLADVQAIGADPFQVDSITGDVSTMIVAGKYSPPAYAVGFAGVVGYWEIPAASGNFVFAGEADYDGDIEDAGVGRYGTFLLRAALPSVGASWGLRLVTKGVEWRGMVSASSPVRALTVPAAAASDAGNNAVDNASFEFGLTRWFGFTAGVTADTSVSKLPSTSCKVTATTTQYVQQPEFAADGNADVILASPGDRLEFSGWYQFDAGSTNTVAKARLVCYNAAGAETGSSDSAVFDPSITAWAGFSLSLTAPASTKYARWVPFSGAIGSGAIYLDALLGRISSQSDEPNKTPLDYGAAGDGTTNDTTAVAACAAANDAWEVPGGYTFLTDAVTFSSRSNIRITGTGKLKKRTGSSGTALLVFDSCGSVRLSQVALDANGFSYCARLTGTSGTEGWMESCDFSNFTVDPLDVVAGTGSDYYAYNNAGLSDRLVWIAAVAPSGLTVTVTTTAANSNQYGISLSTTLPSGTDAEEAVGFEYRASYYDNSGLTGTPDVRMLGLSGQAPAFGPYDRQLTDYWVHVDVRSYNALNRYSAWYTGATAAKIDKIPGPSAPTSVTTTISQAAGEYSLDTTVVLPSDPAIVGFRRAAYFYTSAVIGTPESVTPLAELSLDLTTLQFLDGPFSADKSDYWVEVGVETVSRDLAVSAPTMSARLKINADTSNGGLDGDLRDIVFDTSYGDSAGGWFGVGLCWKLASKPGCINLKARYEPPLDGIAPAVTTLLKYIAPFVETDVNPAVNGSSLIQGFGDLPYFGNPQGDSEGRKGYIEIYDVPVSTYTIYLHGLGKSLTGGQEFKRVRSATPPSSTRYLSLTLSPTDVTSTEQHPLAAITGAGVEVEERQIEGGWEGRYKHTFTPPSSDPWYAFTRIRGNWCDSSFTPATQFDADPGFGAALSPIYSDWWLWPEQAEYHQYRYTPVDQRGNEILTDAPVVNFTLIGRPKTVVPADATPPVALTAAPYSTAADVTGVTQWYLFAGWNGETPTPARSKLAFSYVTANASWVATSTARPLGSASIAAGGLDLPPQAWWAAEQRIILSVFIESAGGQLGLCSTFQLTIPAGPAGQLDPLQLALTKMGDFQINTDNPAAPFLEITNQGVTNRIKLGARLGLNTAGQLETTGLVADWVLAALGAFSSRVLVSNGQGSVDIGATGTIEITNGNGTITLSPSGGIRVARGSYYVDILSDRIVMSAGSAGLTLSGGAGAFSGGVSASGAISSPSGFELWSGGLPIGYWNATHFSPGVPINGVTWDSVSGKPTTFAPAAHAYSSHSGLPTLGAAAAKDVGYGVNDVASGQHVHYAGSGITGNWSGTIHGRDGQEISVVNGMVTGESYSS